MSPRDLPDGSFVASQLCSLLTLPAFDDIENLDAPIGSGTGQLFAVVIKLDVVLQRKQVAVPRGQMSRCTYTAQRKKHVSLLPDSQGRQLKRREGAGMGKSVCEYTGARTMRSSCCAGSLSTAVSVRLADIGCKDYRKPPPQRVRAGEGGERGSRLLVRGVSQACPSQVVLCLVMTRALLLLLSVAGCSCAHASGVAAVSVSHRRLSPANMVTLLRGGEDHTGSEHIRELEETEQLEALHAESSETGKVLILDFTASWCGPCQYIAPTFHALAEEHSDKAIFVVSRVRVPDCSIFFRVLCSRNGPCSQCMPVLKYRFQKWQCIVQSVDVDNFGDLAAELGVSAMPTFLFFRYAARLAAATRHAGPIRKHSC